MFAAIRRSFRTVASPSSLVPSLSSMPATWLIWRRSSDCARSVHQSLRCERQCGRQGACVSAAGCGAGGHRGVDDRRDPRRRTEPRSARADATPVPPPRGRRRALARSAPPRPRRTDFKSSIPAAPQCAVGNPATQWALPTSGKDESRSNTSCSIDRVNQTNSADALGRSSQCCRRSRRRSPAPAVPAGDG